MAEQDRLTKAERREQKRQQRLAEEAAAASKASKDRIRNAAIGAVSVAAIGGLVFAAVGNNQIDPLLGVTITPEEGEAALLAAGCEPVEGATELPDRTHFEPTDIPPAETLYTNGRPTNSGSHYVNPGGVLSGVATRQLDEYATTHNLEHGSIIVWFDPEQVSDDDVDEMDEWLTSFNAAGFENPRSGAGLFASPYTEPGITSGKAIALRAWGVSVDCDAWNETAVNAFTIDHYGTNGSSPESALGPYPFEALRYADTDVPQDAPEEGDVGDMAPTDDATEE